MSKLQSLIKQKNKCKKSKIEQVSSHKQKLAIQWLLFMCIALLFFIKNNPSFLMFYFYHSYTQISLLDSHAKKERSHSNNTYYQWRYGSIYLLQIDV